VAIYSGGGKRAGRIPTLARKFFPALPFYKIIKILTSNLFFFFMEPPSSLFPRPSQHHSKPMLIFFKGDLLSFNP
jgi:hypothetical protein